MNPAALFAVDPAGTGGAVLRGPPGLARDRWLDQLRAALPDGAPMRRVPLHVSAERLLGGLDLAATLQAGRPCAERGLLADSDGGVLLLAMAERLGAGTVAHITSVMDQGAVVLQRHGVSGSLPVQAGVVALDEGAAPEEGVAPPLLDRLAFHVLLEQEDPGPPAPVSRDSVAAARLLLAFVEVDPDILDGLCAAAAALGIASIRAPLLAARVARAAAALAGRRAVTAEDAALAARLVLAPRATVLPEPAPPPGPDEEPDHQDDTDSAPLPEGPVADTVLEAALAAIPAGLLAQLHSGPARGSGPVGRKGLARNAGRRGRPAGVRAGDPGGALRLNLIATLRAAAPWQGLRAQPGQTGIQVRRQDFRVTRLKARRETTTIFIVDASGSHSVNRMAEAKGAVQLLLAECYVRRDQVAVLAFRGKAAELLLPPTRSLVRAKRSLAGLPGGGGTPLAAGIDAGCALAGAVHRRGGVPALVLLTDGRPNVGRDGKGGRAAARNDAEDAARRVRDAGHACILVDTSPRPYPDSARLAQVMGARYVPLPYADGAALVQALRPGP